MIPGRGALRQRALRRWFLYPSIAGLSACGAASDFAPDAPKQPAAEAPPAPTAAPMAPPHDRPAMAALAPMPVVAAEAMPADMRREAQAGQWAPVREFPAPTYGAGQDGPRTDFRETIFWRPSIQTGQDGRAEVDFFLSDSITSFRATAEGFAGHGAVGHGEALIASKLPVSMATRFPLEVSSGDRIELPVTITNTTARPYEASIAAQFGPAIALDGEAPGKVSLRPRESRAFYYGLRVTGTGLEPGAGDVSLAVESARLTDSMKRTIRIVPSGFPRRQSIAGTVTGAAKATFDLPEALPGTLVASMAFYPSPKATLLAGTEGMLQEPTGCFEQASSANYPNVMVMGYLAGQDAADAALAARTTELLDRGYKKIAGYETKGRGYEWFGADPGHEALTAYGLMEFADMAKVYKGVDASMVSRTAAWLKARRDGKGGYQRNGRALDSFGAAGDDVTNAYITYALTEVGERDLDVEIAAVRRMAKSTGDTYVLALAANALVNADAAGADTAAALARLEGKQSKQGDFPGADHSITRSGGAALEIETAALAALALMKAGPEHRPAALRAVTWIEGQRSGAGVFGSTQSTVLALKALTRAAPLRGALPEGTIRVVVNGREAREIKLDPKASGAIQIDGLAGDLKRGQNVVEIASSAAGVELPYAVNVEYRTLRPASSPKAPVSIQLSAPAAAKLGESVRVSVDVANDTRNGLPMVIARVGIPGGLTYQTWQLDELKKKGLVDFYETREREVIAYFRAMAPEAHKRFDIDLLASVPGTYAAPASQAYLYYTDEHRKFADPIRITVGR